MDSIAANNLAPEETVLWVNRSTPACNINLIPIISNRLKIGQFNNLDVYLVIFLLICKAEGNSAGHCGFV